MAETGMDDLRLRLELLESQVEKLGGTLREVVDLARSLNKLNKESSMYGPEAIVQRHDEIEAKLRSARAHLEGR